MFCSSAVAKCLSTRNVRSLFRNYRCFYYKLNALKGIQSKEISCVSQNNLINTKYSCRSYVAKTNEETNRKSMKSTENNSVSDIFKNLKEHGRVFLDQVYKILDLGLENLTEEQAAMLLQCCGNLLPDQLPEIRIHLSEDVWENMKKAGICLNYQTYISVCTENKYLINYKQLLKEVDNVDANLLKLILENICEVGNTERAYCVIEEMKKRDIPADEQTFNCIILASAIERGLDAAKSVLETMKAAQISPSVITYATLLKGLARRLSEEEFLSVFQLLPSPLTEKSLLHIVKELGENDNQDWLRHIAKIKNFKHFSWQNMQYLDNICIQLIYLEKPDAAIAIYTQLVENTTAIREGNYGLFLLREMLKKEAAPKDILKAVEHLKTLNPLAQMKITEIALRNGYTDTAWELLRNTKPLRPHYFWSLLIKAAKQHGETGLFQAITKMVNLGVQPEEITLETYILPYCDFHDPTNLIQRLKSLGFTIKELLTPMLKILLKHNEINQARKLCEMYEATIEGNSLLPCLSTAWSRTGDTKNVVPILQKICETNSRTTDWAGQFLERTLSFCRKNNEFIKFLKLAKTVCSKKLRISAVSADALTNDLHSRCNLPNISKEIEDCIDILLDVSFKAEEEFIPHPRNMDLNELECHFEELKSKRMETRGVLRKLIQMHSQNGNFERVKELRTIFKKSHYSESPGMKAGILHNYILNKNLPEALSLYEEIVSNHPSFHLDSFKILDLASLMVFNGQIKGALNLLKRETQKHQTLDTKSIEHNCVDLLNSYENANEQNEMFNLLLSSGYCSATSAILKPLIKIHLENDDTEKATEAFLDFSKKYKEVPLQIELLCALIEKENYTRLQEVLNVAANIRGSHFAQFGIISALANKGLYKTIRKIILDTGGLSEANLSAICNSWVKQGQLSNLETFAKSIRNLPQHVLDKSVVYQAIMKIHSNKNDVESALLFWQNLQEDQDFNSDLIENELVSLMKRCKHDIPDKLKPKLALN